jgi:hypothetical protein
MIKPQNLTAQLHYRGRGNPPNSQPVSAISNCFPGLEMDFRAIWRRMFVGIVLIENNNYVLEGDPAFEDLIHHRLLLVDDFPTGVATSGVVNPNFPPAPLSTGSNPNGVSFMEWSNSLARIMAKQGQKVRCGFTPDKSDTEVLFDKNDPKPLLYRDLEVRRFFEVTDVAGQPTPQPVIARALANPGELTQGLCSPWQNDYRECACYYWAASRPDYVNVVAQRVHPSALPGAQWHHNADVRRRGQIDHRAARNGIAHIGDVASVVLVDLRLGSVV